MLFAVRRIRPFQVVVASRYMQRWWCNRSDGLEEAGRGWKRSFTCTNVHARPRHSQSTEKWCDATLKLRYKKTARAPNTNSLFPLHLAVMKFPFCSLEVQLDLFSRAVGGRAKQASKHGAVNLTADVQCGLLSRNQRCHFLSRKAKGKSHLFFPLRWLSEVSEQSGAEQSGAAKTLCHWCWRQCVLRL